nr:translational initiation factor 1 [Cuphea micropetala]UPQ43962.1 translational initiation factor 1 [Cuphea micropetala]
MFGFHLANEDLILGYVSGRIPRSFSLIGIIAINQNSNKSLCYA